MPSLRDRLAHRQSLGDDLGQDLRLGLARGLVAKLRDGNAEAHAVLARRHAIAPPQRIVGTDLNMNGLGVDAVLLKSLLEVVQKFAGIVRTAWPVHDAENDKSPSAEPLVGVRLDTGRQGRGPDAGRGMGALVGYF